MLTLCNVAAAAVGLPLAAVGLLLLVLWVKARKTRCYPVPEASTNSVIVISGCDTGIGRETALALLAKGFHVVATTFTKEGPEHLAFDAQPLAGELSTIPVDITKAASVEKLVVFLEDLLDLNPQKKVVGLVNNAGNSWLGPIEVQQMELFIKQLELNLFGHVRMTQAVLPFVRDDAANAGGRVVNLCSIAGRIAAPTMGAYAASKHAMEAITDALRRELRHLRVSVSAIEPGFIQTPLVRDTDHDKEWATWIEGRRELYRGFYERGKRNGSKIYDGASSPVLVANAIVHALTAARPRTHYLVGKDACAIAFLVWLLPDRFLDELMALLSPM